MSEILKDLNDEQKRAVGCESGPMLIVAGAGSGKTRVLTSRIAYLIEKGVSPERILALTFTKKAAGEMKDRIGLMVGERKARRIWMGTFHSVFIRFLRDYADKIGYPSNFTIYDQTDSVTAIKTCIKNLNLDDKVYKPREVQSRISKAKNDLITPKRYADGQGGYLQDDLYHKKPEIYRIYAEYCRLCQRSWAMDFDDILLYTNILFKDEHKDVLMEIGSRFDHILVDEYQDTNMAQYRIIYKLANQQKGHKNICVVGDDSQSIYGFRGAQIKNILNFQKDFAEARIFRLVNNYRSTQNIVNAANSVIARNEGRIRKDCISMGEKGEPIHVVRTFTEQEEAMQTVSSIINRIRMDGAQYQDFAILYRTNSQSRALEEQLRRRNIPYIIYSGNSFFDRAEVKDMMAYFKLAVNTNDDVSFRRIVNKPTRGIGDTSLNSLAAAAQDSGVSLFAAASLPNLERYGLKEAAIGKIRAFCNIILKASDRIADAYDAAMSLAQESGLYLFYKADTSVEGQSRFANLEELLNSVKLFMEDAEEQAVDEAPRVDLSSYLENVSLLSNVDVSDEESANKVALMTVHTAKGLEFPYVYVTGMEENLFPSGGWLLTPQDLEEERRLFYVAITRAKRVVTVSFAQTRMRNGKHESNSPSRFLREIAPQYLDHPLTREDMEGGRRNDDDDEDFGSVGFSWRRGSFGERRPVTVYGSRPAPKPSVTPGKDRASAVKPPVIDANFVPDPMTSFKAGDSIEHNRFGKGKILEILGQVPDLKARVHFDQYGDKLLILKFAKMRHR